MAKVQSSRPKVKIPRVFITEIACFEHDLFRAARLLMFMHRYLGCMMSLPDPSVRRKLSSSFSIKELDEFINTLLFNEAIAMVSPHTFAICDISSLYEADDLVDGYVDTSQTPLAVLSSAPLWEQVRLDIVKMVEEAK